jgi:hypothetical protein
MKVTTKLHKRNERVGRFVFKHFEAISWLFTIILVVSLVFSAYSLYNLFVFGTCDPVSGQCVFTQTASECTSPSCIGEECSKTGYNACDENCDCNEGACT